MRRRSFQHDCLPSLKDWVCNVQLPVDGLEKRHFVGVDLVDLEAGDFAPGPSRVISVLEVFRGQNQGGQEHAATALQSPQRLVLGLLHGEVNLGDVRLDEDEVVKCDLEGRVAGPGSAERLLNKGSKRQHTAAGALVATGRHREGPNHLDHLGRRVDEAVNKLDSALALANQSGRRTRVDSGTSARVAPRLCSKGSVHGRLQRGKCALSLARCIVALSIAAGRKRLGKARASSVLERWAAPRVARVPAAMDRGCSRGD